MQLTYYSKYDPRRFTAPVKTDADLANLVAQQGEPLTITFAPGIKLENRLVIRRDITFVGDVKALFLLTNDVHVKFVNSTVTPFVNKTQPDVLPTIALSSNFHGQLEIQQSTIKAIPTTHAIGLLSGNEQEPKLVRFDHATVYGATVLATTISLSGQVVIQTPENAPRSTLNCADLQTSNLTLRLSNTQVMHPSQIVTIMNLFSDAGRNQLQGQFAIKKLTIASNNNSLEQVTLSSKTYPTTVVVDSIELDKSLKQTTALFIDGSTLHLNHTNMVSSAKNPRATLRNGTVKLTAVTDVLTWSVSGDSHIEIDAESVSNLLQYADQYRPVNTTYSAPIVSHKTTNQTTPPTQQTTAFGNHFTPTPTVDQAPSSSANDAGEVNNQLDPSGLTAEERLHQLIGLQNVKDRIDQFIANVIMDTEREKRGILVDTPLTRHMIFFGNPGTGKTTVARLVAEILHEHGALKANKVVEVLGGDLVDVHVGGTVPKVNALVDKALGGILFIDEAYMLNESKATGSYVQEAVDTLMQRAENERNNLMIILAGYTGPMYELLETGNPGFKSRFPNSNHITFPDYSLEEKIEICEHMLEKSSTLLDTQIYQTAKFKSLLTFYGRDHSNARSVRNLVEALILARDTRLSSTSDISSLSTDSLTRITPADILDVYEKALEAKKIEDNAKNTRYTIQPTFELPDDPSQSLDPIKNESSGFFGELSDDDIKALFEDDE